MGKQIDYRNRRMARGDKPLYVMLSRKATENLDASRNELSRAQFLEKLFSKPVDSANLPD